ncbi:MAG TPA: glutamate--tRNA ligase [Longimicrobiales bacterium]|nr:glutamate--tRNA ligase [Longimicrobiales bacterium]
MRFAPSPTGYLHVGGARTALFNWLLARHHGGAFVLRIEDTDRERSSDDMTRAILDGMAWLGLDWDEGPLHQADGLQRHREDAHRLLQDGSAYRCFCTPEQLDERRAIHPDGPAAFRYDRRCAGIDSDQAADRAAAGEACAIRFRVPDGATGWDDAVYGAITFANADIEDFVILRTDGTPVYNLAVVSDDIAMRISHVVRGDDHISNTPKQILLYQALGQPCPVFAHVPMILGPDGRRLSKRHGATAIGEYHDQGFLPDAMVNFLALLGWSPGSDQEIYSRNELVERFSLSGINRKSAVFDVQKLEWMNGRYLAGHPSADLARRLRDLTADAGTERPEDWWLQLADILKVRSRTVAEMALQAGPFLMDAVHYDDDAVARHWKDPLAVADRLERLAARLATVEPFTEEPLETAIRAFAAEDGIGAGKLIHPLRVALTGQASSPGIFEVARLLGREQVLGRLATAVSTLRQTPRNAPN